MRGQKREGVNMEYLKNVVMQYMVKRDTHSTDQKGLAPVIFMMLQFTEKEKKLVLAADSSWSLWGSSSSSKALAPPPPPMPLPKARPAAPAAPAAPVSPAAHSAAADDETTPRKITSPPTDV
jgi:hypothetical protein